LTVLLTALILSISATSHSDTRWKVVQPYNAKLERMAWCESRKRWSLNTHNGYYGGLQFDLSTWKSVGGRSYPHRNSKLEQKFRAVKLIRKRGYRPWPRCGSV
jgi:Transglycosylase-like domain